MTIRNSLESLLRSIQLEALLLLAASFGAPLGLFMLLRSQHELGLGLHVGSALLTGFAVASSARRRALPGSAGLGVAGATIAVVVPGLGCLGVSALWARLVVPGPAAKALGEYVEVTWEAVGGTQAALAQAHAAPAVARGQGSPLEHVASVRSWAPSAAVPVLRHYLNHPQEDVRLLSYALLEREEQRIRRRIQKILDRGAALPDAASRSRELSVLYFELVHSGLVQGQVREQVLMQVRDHLMEVLDAEPDDGSCWVLFARTQLMLGARTGAFSALVRAERCGVTSAVTLPLRAEVAFASGRYENIRSLLEGTASVSPLRPRTAALLRQWRGEKVFL